MDLAPEVATASSLNAIFGVLQKEPAARLRSNPSGEIVHSTYSTKPVPRSLEHNDPTRALSCSQPPWVRARSNRGTRWYC